MVCVSRMVDIKMRTKFLSGNMNGREGSFCNLNAARIEDCTTSNDRVIDEKRECGRKHSWSKWPFKMPAFCRSLSTGQFKCPVRDGVTL